jgi:hypothetical protein
MRAVATLLLLATTAAAADPVLCVPPRARAFTECAKGSSTGEDDVARCRVREARRKAVPPRLRVDGGPWVTFASKAWTCVPIPATKVRIALENFGRVFASWTLDAGAPCPSQTFDVVGPNFYGAVYARCARRAHPAAVSP